MCDEKPCGPCAEKRAPCRAAPLVAQAGDGTLVLWGPASVEVVSEDNKLVRMRAIEEALPQLWKRGRLTVTHRDQIVGDVHQAVRVDPSRAPTERARLLVQALGGELRTDVYTVDEAILQAFPDLRPWAGTRQFFVASSVWGDNATSREAQREVREGVLDSYSISGMATRIAQAEFCDAERKCRIVDDIVQLDLSAVTLASRTAAKPGTFQAKARNPGARAIIVQQAVVPITPPEGGPIIVEQGSTMPETQQQPAGNGGQNPEPSAGAASVLEAIKQALADFGRRLEALEQGQAELRGQQPAEEPEKKEEEAPAEEKEEEEPKVEQATPAPAAPAPKATQATPAPAPKATPATPAILTQAEPPRRPAVRTPAPAAAPSTTAPSGPPEHIQTLQQAAESGNPAEFRNALYGLRTGRPKQEE